MDKEQFAAIVAEALEYRDLQVREASNGFIITGQRRFVNKDTGAVVLQQSIEAVANTPDAAADSIALFLTGGSFEPSAKSIV